MIVVSTPTGSIGRQVLDTLVDTDTAVRVIVRDPARLDPRVRERAEVVQGSMTDVDVVTSAFTGADTVLWVVPPDPRAASIAGHVLDFVGPLCAGITTQGVRRVVGVSSLGRGIARNAGQISAIFAMDDLVESTGVHYRSLCMPGFMDNMLRQVHPIRHQGVFYSTLPAGVRVPTCATRDIAAVAAGLLLDDTWTGQQNVPVLGPEDLSDDELAEIMTEVLQRPVRAQQVPAEAYKASLVDHGLSDAWAQGLVDMSAAVQTGIYAVEPGTSRAATPTTFRQWCTDVLRPAVLAA
ncbi:NAD(P)H-binding protein [Actinocatenispora rupis]|uniref:NmrA family transcriptional regulator n=1 Tax=Actinocatenispora rupis TaxID=519421 RepID=A0A8J3J1S8_9ACTN|nr:NAD(P)H-binding protein [Actinocatenispora rupis]GID12623.1 NmrA family transcriptional regulator [Actinocatenispora rupis]